METFYEMSVKLVGELPSTSLWIYDIVTMFLLICSICMLVIPTSLIFKRLIGIGGRL